MKEKTAAVVLAAGKGKRMNSDIPKQYMLLRDKPVLYYSLKVFQESFVDEIVLVAERKSSAGKKLLKNTDLPKLSI